MMKFIFLHVVKPPQINLVGSFLQYVAVRHTWTCKKPFSIFNQLESRPIHQSVLMLVTIFLSELTSQIFFMFDKQLVFLKTLKSDRTIFCVKNLDLKIQKMLVSSFENMNNLFWLNMNEIKRKKSPLTSSECHLPKKIDSHVLAWKAI